MQDKISDFFINRCNEYGDPISNLKLQKLLYYAQAWHIALYDKQLFGEDFQAWVYGPVLKSQYDRFKQYGSGMIGEAPDMPKLDKHLSAHLDEILSVFSGYSAFQLAMMTHEEDPWKNARKGLSDDSPSDNLISKKDMDVYFKKLANSSN